MANTYTQLRIQLVFAVKGREHMIPKQNREQVEKYMTTVVQDKKHKLLAIYCMPDHVHILIGLNPEQSISKLVSELKTGTTKFIKKQDWMPFDFSWQKGYGAFSYSKSQTDQVVKYILNQEVHHQNRTFKEEYLAILNRLDIDFEEQYVFEFYD